MTRIKAERGYERAGLLWVRNFDRKGIGRSKSEKQLVQGWFFRVICVHLRPNCSCLPSPLPFLPVLLSLVLPLGLLGLRVVPTDGPVRPLSGLRWYDPRFTGPGGRQVLRRLRSEDRAFTLPYHGPFVLEVLGPAPSVALGRLRMLLRLGRLRRHGMRNGTFLARPVLTVHGRTFRDCRADRRESQAALRSAGRRMRSRTSAGGEHHGPLRPRPGRHDVHISRPSWCRFSKGFSSIRTGTRRPVPKEERSVVTIAFRCRAFR